MKPITTAAFAALMLLAVSCKKESTTIQSSGITDESSTQALSSDASELAGGRAIRIGNQVWMKRDLTVSHYRNGDTIPEVNAAEWSYMFTGAWCWYGKNPAACKLYNWYAVNDPRGLAPEGWHIPSKAEWTRLSTYLGGDAVAGGKMKSTGTIEDGTGLWYAPNTGATNSSGFTGLPGGFRSSDGTFYSIGNIGYWWSSNEAPFGDAWYRAAVSYDQGLSEHHQNRGSGYSVRCIKD